MNESRNAAREKWSWLQAVAADKTLSNGAVRLAVVLCDYINRVTGKGWPSQTKLGERIGAVERAVRNYTKELVEAGYLVADRRPGRPSNSNSYELRIPAQPFRFSSRDSLPLFDQETGTGVPVGKPETGKKLHGNRNNRSEETGTGVPPNLLREPVIEPVCVCTAPLDELIELWGSTRSDALQAAFESALKHAPAELIVEAARAWVAPPRPAFPRNLATWLRERRWSEHPAANGDARPKRRSPKRTRVDIALDKLREQERRAVANDGGDDGDSR